MSNPTVWRLAWKEYRMLRGFWIAIAVLAVGFEGSFLVLFDGPQQRIGATFAAALVFGALYALGCGATLFATERETGTYDWLRSLPLSAGRLLAGKLMFAALSVSAMLLVLWLTAYAFSGRALPPADQHRILWTLWGLAAVELLAWGVLFSLLFSHPLKSVLLAVLCWAAAVQGLSFISGENLLELQDYGSALPGRLLVLAVLAVVDVAIALRWLRERTEPSAVGEPVRGLFQASEAVRMARLPSSGTVVSRLVWQQWHQSRWMILAVSALFAPLAAVLLGAMLLRWWSADTPHLRQLAGSDVLTGLAVLLAMIAVPIGGVIVFLADQWRHSVEFLGDRGVKARDVWLSRHFVVGAAVLLWIAVLTLVFAGAVYAGDETVRERGGVLFVWLVGYVLLGYTAGQLCSMFVRSGILSAFFALVLTAAVMAWARLMSYLGVPWWWSVASIPLVFLATTYVRAPHWLLQRGGWKGWRGTVGVLTLPTAALLGGVAIYRATEIPKVGPGFSPRQFIGAGTEEGERTADMYLKAYDAFVPRHRLGQVEQRKSEQERGGAMAEWLKMNEPALELAIETTRRPSCDAFGRERLADAGTALGSLLLESGRRLGQQGDLDGALARYEAAVRLSVHVRSRSRWWWTGGNLETSTYALLVEWAARPGQSGDRVRDALEMVKWIGDRRPSYEHAIQGEYLSMRELVSGGFDAWVRSIDPDGAEDWRLVWFNVAVLWMPWERERAIRALNEATSEQLADLKAVERALDRAEEVEMPPSRWAAEYHRLWQRKTPIMVGYPPLAGVLSEALVSIETRRRALLLQLALQAWQLEHGTLPENLDALVGPYLDTLPVDPYTGQPYQYFPNGLPVPLTRHENVHTEPRVVLEADVSFVWAAGPEVQLVENVPDPLRRYRIRPRGSTPHQPQTEYEIWAWGEIFPVPAGEGQRE